MMTSSPWMTRHSCQSKDQTMGTTTSMMLSVTDQDYKLAEEEHLQPIRMKELILLVLMM